MEELSPPYEMLFEQKFAIFGRKFAFIKGFIEKKALKTLMKDLSLSRIASEFHTLMTSFLRLRYAKWLK